MMLEDAVIGANQVTRVTPKNKKMQPQFVNSSSDCRKFYWDKRNGNLGCSTSEQYINSDPHDGRLA